MLCPYKVLFELRLDFYIVGQLEEFALFFLAHFAIQPFGKGKEGLGAFVGRGGMYLYVDRIAKFNKSKQAW